MTFARHQTFPCLYVVFVDYGPLGIEAVVDPEDTRSGIVEDIATGQIDRVVSVIEIEDGMARDITDDVAAEVDRLVAEREAAE